MEFLVAVAQVRSGSKADLTVGPGNVDSRFGSGHAVRTSDFMERLVGSTPESGHPNCRRRRPLRASSGRRNLLACKSGGGPILGLTLRHLGTSFEDHVKRRFGSTTHLTESSGLDHFGEFPLSGLGAQCHPDFLR